MKKVELNIAEWRAEFESNRKHQKKYSEDEFVIHMIDRFIEDLKDKITQLANAKKDLLKKEYNTKQKKLRSI